jgi:DUF971 family protein
MVDDTFALHAVAIENRASTGVLEIEWSDGTRQPLAHAMLRLRCQCADCKSAPPVHEAINAGTLRLTDIQPVGTYGVQLIFNDGHERGIYPWAYLHGLRP